LSKPEPYIGCNALKEEDATVLFLSNGKGACEKTALLGTTAGGKVRLVVKKLGLLHNHINKVIMHK